MEFIVKNFTELTAAQVYEILKSSAETFMLGQNIRCLDMDDVDYACRHCFLEYFACKTSNTGKISEKYFHNSLVAFCVPTFLLLHLLTYNEEILFRYIFYNRLTNKYSINKSIIITTTIF